MAGSLDTNVLLRLLLNDVPEQHQQALNLFRAKRGPFTVDDAALIEFAFVLDRHYHLNRPQIAEALQLVMRISVIDCNRQILNRVLPEYLKYPSLSFEDCYLTAAAELSDATPLWTFDRKLATKLPAAKLVPEG